MAALAVQGAFQNTAVLGSVTQLMAPHRWFYQGLGDSKVLGSSENVYGPLEQHTSWNWVYAWWCGRGRHCSASLSSVAWGISICDIHFFCHFYNLIPSGHLYMGPACMAAQWLRGTLLKKGPFWLCLDLCNVWHKLWEVLDLKHYTCSFLAAVNVIKQLPFQTQWMIIC